MPMNVPTATWLLVHCVATVLPVTDSDDVAVQETTLIWTWAVEDRPLLSVAVTVIVRRPTEEELKGTAVRTCPVDGLMENSVFGEMEYVKAEPDGDVACNGQVHNDGLGFINTAEIHPIKLPGAKKGTATSSKFISIDHDFRQYKSAK